MQLVSRQFCAAAASAFGTRADQPDPKLISAGQLLPEAYQVPHSSRKSLTSPTKRPTVPKVLPIS